MEASRAVREASTLYIDQYIGLFDYYEADRCHGRGYRLLGRGYRLLGRGYRLLGPGTGYRLLGPGTGYRHLGQATGTWDGYRHPGSGGTGTLAAAVPAPWHRVIGRQDRSSGSTVRCPIVIKDRYVESGIYGSWSRSQKET